MLARNNFDLAAGANNVFTVAGTASDDLHYDQELVQLQLVLSFVISCIG